MQLASLLRGRPSPAARLARCHLLLGKLCALHVHGRAAAVAAATAASPLAAAASKAPTAPRAKTTTPAAAAAAAAAASSARSTHAAPTSRAAAATTRRTCTSYDPACSMFTPPRPPIPHARLRPCHCRRPVRRRHPRRHLPHLPPRHPPQLHQRILCSDFHVFRPSALRLARRMGERRSP